MRKLCKGPPIDASCIVWFHLATRFQRRRFLKFQPIRNENCPWRPYFSSDRNEMRKLCKGPSIDASCIVWFHLAKWFQRRRFLKIRPIRNKNCPWRPYLLSDRDEMRKLYKGPYIDASCQVWFHLAQWFQRRRLKCEKLTTTDDGWRRTDTSWWQKLTLTLWVRWAKNKNHIYWFWQHLSPISGCHMK